MAVKLKELYKGFNRSELKMLAGKEGLNNIVRWVHMVEGTSISLFLEEQELAFTTGIALRKEGELFELVKLCNKNNSSGVVINTGPFIKEIPQEIIDYCNEESFPLFEVPWDIYIAEMMKKLCYQITLSDRVVLELSAAIKNAIFLPEQEEIYLSQMERYGFKPKSSYCAAIIDIEKGTDTPVDTKRQEFFLKKIENLITYSHPNTFIFGLDNKLILIFSKYKGTDIKKILSKLKKNIKGLLNTDEQLYISMGECAGNITELHKSYNKSLNSLKIQKKKSLSDEILNYKDLGVYKLLLAIEDKNVINEFCQETLGVLETHDELNDSDYVVVLESYLRNSGSIKAVAEELFFHRNTICYKLNKIEEIIGSKLSNLDTRLKYSIALMLKEIY